jgi:hypothetical protein
MKTSAFLFTASVALALSAFAFLYTQKSIVGRSFISPPQTFAPDDPELQKTQASLRRLENIRLAGESTPLDRLLPSRGAGISAVGNRASLVGSVGPAGSATAFWSGSGTMLFPVHAQDEPGARGETGYVNSGYTNSIEGGPAAGNPPVTEKVNTASMTYISRGFRRAVVDGELVREGNRLPDGARVSSIRKDAVFLIRDEKRYGVRIPKPLSNPPLQARETR